MTTQGLTLCENNSKEMVFYNRRDDFILNINEMLYLEKYHSPENKIDYPFVLDNKLCLAKAEDKDLVDKMLKLLV